MNTKVLNLNVRQFCVRPENDVLFKNCIDTRIYNINIIVSTRSPVGSDRRLRTVYSLRSTCVRERTTSIDEKSVVILFTPLFFFIKKKPL